MRTFAMRRHVRILKQAGFAVLIATSVTACSSDFTRFDRNLYAALPAGAQQNTAASNPYPGPYPGDVDPTTTASIAGGEPHPIGAVQPAIGQPDHAGYQPLSNVNGGVQTNYGSQTAGAAPSYGSGVIKRELPGPVNPAAASAAKIDSVNTASIAAPDNNPVTRASRTSTGLLGQAAAVKVAVPRHSPLETAALSGNSGLDTQRQQIERAYGPQPLARDGGSRTPDRSIATGSLSRSVPMDGVYTVKSGDSLSGIASRSGTSVKALMDANGLDSPDIRVGQTLQLPAAGHLAAERVASNTTAAVQGPKLPAAPKAYVKPTVDDTVTGSVSAKAPERTGIKTLRWPVSGRVISGFGDSRRSGPNDGIDISVPEGTAVRAAENGVVIYSGSDLEGFGNLILIRHADGIVTAYAHNKANHVNKGAEVKRGQQIAASGRTGSATVPMLHFEVRKNAKPVDPEKYLGG